MEGGKYEHLIKALNIGATNGDDANKAVGGSGLLPIGPGHASREIRLNGRDHLEGLELNLSWGIHTGVGDWHAGLDPHVHPYQRCLLFVGLDTANVNYLGAEISFCLGAEQETHAFDEPTVIVIPAGLPHGPITTNKIYSPKGFGCWAVELNSVSETTWLGEGISSLPAGQRGAQNILRTKPGRATGKYTHLVKSLKSGLLIERRKLHPSRFNPDQPAGPVESRLRTGGEPGPGNPDHLIWMRGEDLDGINANIFWGFCSQPGVWQRGAGSLVHPFDEVLIYLGADSNNMDSLGAEIEMDMGEEHERHIIDKPTAVICPAGTPHTSQVTRWVDKPFAFFAVSLSGE